MISGCLFDLFECWALLKENFCHSWWTISFSFIRVWVCVCVSEGSSWNAAQQQAASLWGSFSLVWGSYATWSCKICSVNKKKCSVSKQKQCVCVCVSEVLTLQVGGSFYINKAQFEQIVKISRPRIPCCRTDSYFWTWLSSKLFLLWIWFLKWRKQDERFPAVFECFEVWAAANYDFHKKSVKHFMWLNFHFKKKKSSKLWKRLLCACCLSPCCMLYEGSPLWSLMTLLCCHRSCSSCLELCCPEAALTSLFICCCCCAGDPRAEDHSVPWRTRHSVCPGETHLPDHLKSISCLFVVLISSI